MAQDHGIWVELSGDIIVARIRGVLTDDALVDIHARVMLLLSESGRSLVLYDGLEMEPPAVEVSREQSRNSEELRRLGVRAAILVPNSRVAFAARWAFGEGDHKIIYNDLAEAVRWLTHDVASVENDGSSRGTC